MCTMSPKSLPHIDYAAVPFRWVGPVKLQGDLQESIPIPLATYEDPLWPSVHRGARVSNQAGGIQVTLIDERMARSIALEADNAQILRQVSLQIAQEQQNLQKLVTLTSRFAQLIDIHTQIIGNLLFIRFEFLTGDASGHNMVTQAADHLMDHLLKKFPQLKYVSISGNFCTDKKVSAVNGILGRGKNVVAEVTIPRKLVQRYLKTTPEKLVDLHIKKDLLGSIAAGGLRTANAHAANMLLAFYLATGQDAANIVEGSPVINHAEVVDGDLYFSTTCPNLIMGTVGNGKDLDFVNPILEAMGCRQERQAGDNARRLALVCAATVLCGELSLLAAQTNPGELMAAHLRLERQKS